MIAGSAARPPLARAACLNVFITVLVAVAAGCGSGAGGDGEPAEYPARPIEVVSWATPGGPTDLLARELAETGPEHFGVEMRVATRQGGSGAAAMRHVSSRPADGHTLLIFTSSGAVNMATGRIPFGPEDFTYLMRVQVDPFLIAVPSESPFRDLEDFFDHARENPGELSVAGFGSASAHFLGFSRLSEAAGDPDVRWIAYGGSGEAVVAALGGHTDAVHTNYNIVREHLRAGSMRVLGVSAPVPALPDVPTYSDQGYDVQPVHWRGVAARGDLPDSTAARIRELLDETVEDPEFRDFMETAAMGDGRLDSAGQFQREVRREVEERRKLLRSLGLLEDGDGGTEDR